MKKSFILILTFLCFISCNNSSNILETDLKLYGFIHGNQLDYTSNIYVNPEMFDSIENKKLLYFLTMYENKPKIEKDKIIYPYKKEINKEIICCDYDTSNFYIEKVKNETFLFMFNKEEDKTLFYKLGDDFKEKEKKRKVYDLPTWGIRIGDYVEPDKIETGENWERYKTLNTNYPLKIETLSFDDSPKYLICQINKELLEDDYLKLLDFVKTKYPELEFKEKKGILPEIIDTEVCIDGITITFSKWYWSWTNETKYSFSIKDDFTTLKNIISNKGRKYTYNPDTGIYIY